MNSFAWLLIIFVVNKLCVHGEPVLQNINQTTDNGILSQAFGTQALYELNLKEKELVKDENIISKNISKQVENQNVDPDVGLGDVLRNRQIDIEHISGVRDEVVRKASVSAKPITSSEVDSNSQPVQENNFNSQQPGDVINVSDTPNQITVQNAGEIDDQNLSVELYNGLKASQNDNQMPNALPVRTATQTNKINKYEISSLPSNLTQDLLVSHHENNYLNNLNQSWTENRAKAINEYKIAQKSFNSQEVLQSSSLAESELIEIVLKEATNLKKLPEERNFSPGILESNSKAFEIKKAIEEKGDLTEQWYEKATDISDPPSNTKLIQNIEKSFNHAAADKQQEEKAVDRVQTLAGIITTTPSEVAAVTLEPQIFNATENVLDRTSIKEVAYIDSKQEESSTYFLESSATLSTDFEPLFPATSESLQSRQTFNESEEGIAFEKVDSFKQTPENGLTSPNPLEKVNTTPEAVNEQNVLEVENQQETIEVPSFMEAQGNVLTSPNPLQKINTIADAVNEQNAQGMKNQQEENFNSFKSSAISNSDTNDFTAQPLKGLKDFTGIENDLEKGNKTENKNGFKQTEALSNIETGFVTPKPSSSVKKSHDSNFEDYELKKAASLTRSISVGQKTSEEVLNFNKAEKEQEKAISLEEATDVSPTEPAAELVTSSNMEPQTPDPLHKSEEDKNDKTTDIYSAIYQNQNHLAENPLHIPAESSSHSVEVEDQDSNPKPVTCLEEYAVKQMNFILDHLLLETHKFVAKVLEATINSVFPRDALKHYAERVNQLLNPNMESDYVSEEMLENTESPDEIYEQIVEKLNFLKSKYNKYLQKQLPPEWLKEFLAKRADLAIWLDKAAEQMQKEFNVYLTEEQDPIKYQYFSETFDDITRATEIHHKLALLADLVKIIKNKKQITFMDLYMQT